jgi:hypothetical protein
MPDFKSLAALQVYVGVPQSTTERPRGAKVTNAELVFIHTNGSPARGIPARPIIEPAIEASDNKAALAEDLKKAGNAALDRRPQDAVKFLKLTGQDAVNRIRAWFTDARNHWAPNVPSTIRAKGSDRPLIDEGELRKAMTYVLKEK